MEICVGDIVERKQRPGRASFDVFGRVDAKMLFYDGYFLVLEIAESTLKAPSGERKVAVARIMCSSGQMSWIGVDNLRKILM